MCRIQAYICSVVFLFCAAASQGDELDDCGDRFIAACRAFEKEQKKLPSNEADLVPKHLRSEDSVVVFQGVRLKFVFVAPKKYMLFPEDAARHVLAVLSRPVRYPRKGTSALSEGRHVVTTSLYGWWVTEKKFEDILSCRENPLPPPPRQEIDGDPSKDGESPVDGKTARPTEESVPSGGRPSSQGIRYERPDDKREFEESNLRRDKDYDHGGHVYVSGEVANPRKIRVGVEGDDWGIGLTQALEAAGGTTKAASGRSRWIIRRRKVFWIDARLGQLDEVRLAEGDLLFVPPTIFLDRK